MYSSISKGYHLHPMNTFQPNTFWYSQTKKCFLDPANTCMSHSTFPLKKYFLKWNQDELTATNDTLSNLLPNGAYPYMPHTPKISYVPYGLNIHTFYSNMLNTLPGFMCTIHLIYPTCPMFRLAPDHSLSDSVHSPTPLPITTSQCVCVHSLF